MQYTTSTLPAAGLLRQCIGALCGIACAFCPTLMMPAADISTPPASRWDSMAWFRAQGVPSMSSLADPHNTRQVQVFRKLKVTSDLSGPKHADNISQQLLFS